VLLLCENLGNALWIIHHDGAVTMLEPFCHVSPLPQVVILALAAPLPFTLRARVLTWPLCTCLMR
jgi:hypothetical protein